MRLKQLFHTLETLKMSDFATEKHYKQTGSRHFVMPLRDPCFFQVNYQQVPHYSSPRVKIQRKCNVPHVARVAQRFTHLLFIKTKKTFFILLSTRLSLSLSIVNNTAWHFFSARQDKFFIYNEYEYTIPPSPLFLSNDFPPCNGRQKARVQEGHP